MRSGILYGMVNFLVISCHLNYGLMVKVHVFVPRYCIVVLLADVLIKPESFDLTYSNSFVIDCTFSILIAILNIVG